MNKFLEQVKEMIADARKSAKAKKNAHKRANATRRSMELFQVREHNKELWFIYDDEYVCPMSMMSQKPVETLYGMRQLFVDRICKTEAEEK